MGYKKGTYKGYWLGKKLSPEHKQKIKENTSKYWLGKHLSEEHKLRLSRKAKGREYTEETRKKMSLGQKGRKHSEETKKKISLAHLGVRDPKISERQRGSKSHLWKGGITPINLLIRSSVEYRMWRKSVFERDNYTCQGCGKKGGYLHADHIKQFAYYPKLRFDINNGRTLCKPCHKKTPTYGGRGRIYKNKKYANV